MSKLFNFKFEFVVSGPEHRHRDLSQQWRAYVRAHRLFARTALLQGSRAAGAQ